MNDSTMEKKPKTHTSIQALFTLTLPEATGRNRLMGCTLSLSRSIMSFIRYATPAAMEKIKKATSVLRLSGKMNIFLLNINGKKINKFLIHCFGLKAKNKYFICLSPHF